MAKFDPNQFKKDLQDLNKLYKELKRDPLDSKAFESGAKGAKQMSIYLREAKTAVNDLNTDFNDLTKMIQNIGEEFNKGFNDPVRQGTKSFKTLKSLASSLEDDLNGVVDLEKKQLVNIKKKAIAEGENLKRLKDQLEAKRKSLRVGEKLTEEEDALLANLKSKAKVQDIIINQANERIEQEKKIAKTAGITGAMFNSLSNTLGKIGIGSEFFEDGKKNIRDAAKSGSKLKVVGAGLSSIFSGLGEALTDPVALFGLLTKTFTSLLALGQKFAKYTSDIGKSFLGMGASSKEISTNLKNMASGDVFLNFEEARKAMVGMNKEAGTAVQFSTQQIKAYQKYSHFLGLSEESTQGLFKAATLSGESFDSVGDTIGGVVTGLNLSNDTSINLNDVMEDVANASAQTSFHLGNNPKALAQAAFDAKRLGMTMAEISSSARSTLDFESSIEKEMKAEMLLGKELNLETLRRATLTGDVGTQASEINRILAENIDSTKGNVIAQEALADSLGMSVEQMFKANQARLLQNELSNKGIKDREKAEKALAVLENKGLSREQALQQLSKQNLDATIKEGEKSEASMRMLENAKETLMVSIAPLADKIASFVAKIAESKELKSMMGMMGDMFKLIANNPLESLGVVGALGLGIKALTGGKLGSNTNPMAVYLSTKKAGTLSKGFDAMKNFFKKKPEKVTQAVMKTTGKKISGAAAQAAVKAGSATAVKKAGTKSIAKLGAKAIGKGILKKIPGVGLLAGIGFGLQRAMKGDFAGAALELASGGASLIPGAGTAASLAIDAGLAARDISKATSGGTAADFISRPGQPIQKFRKDDIIVGGTSLGGGSNNEVVTLLKELISAVKQGGDVYIDGAKAGRSLALATSRMG